MTYFFFFLIRLTFFLENECTQPKIVTVTILDKSRAAVIIIFNTRYDVTISTMIAVVPITRGSPMHKMYE